VSSSFFCLADIEDSPCLLVIFADRGRVTCPHTLLSPPPRSLNQSNNTFRHLYTGQSSVRNLKNCCLKNNSTKFFFRCLHFDSLFRLLVSLGDSSEGIIILTYFQILILMNISSFVCELVLRFIPLAGEQHKIHSQPHSHKTTAMITLWKYQPILGKEYQKTQVENDMIRDNENRTRSQLIKTENMKRNKWKQ